MKIEDYKIGVYIRTAQKDDEAVKRQKDYILAYCNYRQFPEVYKIYIDNGKSGTTENRSAYKRLLKDVRDGKVNVIISTDFERITRQPIYFYHKMVDYISKNKLMLICLCNGLSDEQRMKTKMMLDIHLMKEYYYDGGVE